jgi:hypothetical protein
MNTKNKQDQKNQRQKTRQKQRPKKQGQNLIMLHDDRKYHEQELPETRLTR